jgi:hypothetical protein
MRGSFKMWFEENKNDKDVLTYFDTYVDECNLIKEKPSSFKK